MTKGQKLARKLIKQHRAYLATLQELNRAIGKIGYSLDITRIRNRLPPLADLRTLRNMTDNDAPKTRRRSKNSTRSEARSKKKASKDYRHNSSGYASGYYNGYSGYGASGYAYGGPVV